MMSSGRNRELVGIVGIGASAGGLEAFRRLLPTLDPEAGWAYVLVQHLDPEHETMIPELLANSTSMPVRLVREQVRVEPDHVYVIPPNSMLRLDRDELRLENPVDAAERRQPIDEFFKSLAEQTGSRAVACVFSGTGSDGTVGLQAVKEAGGMTVVQRPETAKYDGMPRSALGSGLVDHVIDLEQLSERLAERVTNLPQEDHVALEEVADSVDTICRILGKRVKHDFTNYKQATLSRRIQRRMTARKTANSEEYVQLLRDDPEECDALFRDLLISVTAFFRDEDAFRALSRALVSILEEAHEVRVWVPGCATGEEAYSLAIIIMEGLRRLDRNDVPVKIFATDIDNPALEVGRSGRYAASSLQRLDRDLVDRYFEPMANDYVVRRRLRECVIFSEHNLISDPPFSRMDLVSCRNVLIYLEAPLQKNVLRLLHYALNPGGLLLLGPAEGVSGHESRFAEVDGSQRIFRAKDTSQRLPPAMAMAMGVSVKRSSAEPSRADSFRKRSDISVLQMRRVLEAYGPASLVVEDDGNIVSACGDLERYLELKSWGPLESNALQLARPELRAELRLGILNARRKGERTVISETAVESRGEIQRLRVVIAPFPTSQADELFLITFHDLAPPEPAPEVSEESETPVSQLEAELRLTRRNLQITVDELETSNEEMMSANEELMSMNEELQSSNEELQTSQEELQSVNEELETVNTELQLKVHQLDRARNDLRNLFEATSIPTLFLDQSLVIKHCTPTCGLVFRIIESDIGRSIKDIVPRFTGADIPEIARRVLRTLQAEELTVTLEGQDRDQHFLCRVHPYRTDENVIDGVVVAFVDVTEQQITSNELRRSELRARRRADELRAIYESVPSGLALLDPELRFVSVNRALAELDGVPAKGHVGRTPSEFLGDAGPQIEELLARVVEEMQPATGVGIRHAHANEVRHYTLHALPILQPDTRELEFVSITLDDVTETVRYQSELEKKDQMLAIAQDASESGVWDWQPGNSDASHFSPHYKKLFGMPVDVDARREDFRAYLSAEERTRTERETEAIFSDPTRSNWLIEYCIRHPTRGRRWLQGRGRIQRDEDGKVTRVTGITVDITERKLMEEALRRSNEHKDEFLAMLGHELRNPLAAIGHVADLLDDAAADTAKIGKLRSILRRQVAHMSRQLDELLDVSRVAAGKLNVTLTTTDLTAVVSDVVGDLQSMFAERGQEMSYERPSEPIYVRGDEVRLSQALGNLLDNARKFTRPEDAVHVTLERIGEEAVLKVRDEGAGMEPELLEHLFEPFQQGPQDLSRDLGGLGLGLSLVQGIVSLHQGSVTAHSDGPGTGSEFAIRLPAVDKPPDTPIRLEEPRPGVTTEVLLIEDNEDAAELLAELLRGLGHSVRVANSGEAGVQLAQQIRPRFVICDIGLPGMSGFEVAAELRRSRDLDGVRLVALTGYGRTDDRKRSEAAGFDFHLTKPVDIRQLEAVLGAEPAAPDSEE